MAAARSSLALMSVFVVAALALLVGLGTWQLQRLAWKEALIARIETRLAEVPAPLPEHSRVMRRSTFGSPLTCSNVSFLGLSTIPTTSSSNPSVFTSGMP